PRRPLAARPRRAVCRESVPPCVVWPTELGGGPWEREVTPDRGESPKTTGGHYVPVHRRPDVHAGDRPAAPGKPAPGRRAGAGTQHPGRVTPAPPVDPGGG